VHSFGREKLLLLLLLLLLLQLLIEIEVGPLAFVYEYAPHLNSKKFGDIHTLVMMFDCTLKNGSIPKLPLKPDPKQTGVKWFPISELENVQLYANIGKQIKDYTLNKKILNY
jgi:8-oxo-dGTP diphosphatase